MWGTRDIALLMKQVDNRNVSRNGVCGQTVCKVGYITAKIMTANWHRGTVIRYTKMQVRFQKWSVTFFCGWRIGERSVIIHCFIKSYLEACERKEKLNLDMWNHHGWTMREYLRHILSNKYWHLAMCNRDMTFGPSFVMPGTWEASIEKL